MIFELRMTSLIKEDPLFFPLATSFIEGMRMWAYLLYMIGQKKTIKSRVTLYVEVEDSKRTSRGCTLLVDHRRCLDPYQIT